MSGPMREHWKLPLSLPGPGCAPARSECINQNEGFTVLVAPPASRR
jgi:hypothetical protein